MNIIKDAAVGTGNVVKNALTMTTEGIRNQITRTIGGIASWTWSSIWNLMKGTGKLAAKGIARLPIIPI